MLTYLRLMPPSLSVSSSRRCSLDWPAKDDEALETDIDIGIECHVEPLERIPALIGRA